MSRSRLFFEGSLVWVMGLLPENIDSNLVHALTVGKSALPPHVLESKYARDLSNNTRYVGCVREGGRKRHAKVFQGGIRPAHRRDTAELGG
jgi:hypothetical protein